MLNIEEEKVKAREAVTDYATEHHITADIVLLTIIIVGIVIGNTIPRLLTGDFSFDFLQSAKYWIIQLGTLISTTIIYVLAHSTGKKREELSNNVYRSTAERIDTISSKINAEAKTEEFEKHVREKNRARKLHAYLYTLNKKKRKLEKKRAKLGDVCPSRTKIVKRIAEINEKIEKAEDEIDTAFVPRWRWTKIYCTQILSASGVRIGRDDDYSVHEVRSVASSAVFRVLWFLAVGLAVGIFGNTMITEDIFSAIIDISIYLVQVSMAIFFGASHGHFFVKNEELIKMKARLGFLLAFCEKIGIEVPTETDDHTKTTQPTQNGDKMGV